MSSASGAKASTIVLTDVGEGLAAPITDGELYLAVRQAAPNKSPGWDGITLEYYKMYRDVNMDVMLIFHNQMFQETKITAVKKVLLVCLPKKKPPMEPESYKPITLLNADYELRVRILVNRMRQSLSTVMCSGQYCGVSSRTMFGAIAVIRDSLA
jgi:hypothetical protein